MKLLESLLLKEQKKEYVEALNTINENWARALGFQLKTRRPPKWNYAGIATFRIYCCVENCNFGITLRFDAEEQGEFWSLSEPYDVYKMQHSHVVKNVGISPLVAPKIVKYVDEDPIDSDNDSYGDQEMKFDDHDPL